MRGEDPAGIDISRVAVSATADGDIVFRIEIPTHSRFTPDMRIRIWLDSDDDPSTGLDGADQFLLADDSVVALYGCADPPTCHTFGTGLTPSLRFSYEGGPTFSVDSRDLRKSKRFRFSVSAYSGILHRPDGSYDFSNWHSDFAPDGAYDVVPSRWWTFDTRALVAKSFSATPATARAGQPFTLRLTTIRTDTGAVLESGKVSCSLRIAGSSVKARTSGLFARRAVCGFDVPVGAKGKRYRAFVTVRTGANAITRLLSGRVR